MRRALVITAVCLGSMAVAQVAPSDRADPATSGEHANDTAKPRTSAGRDVGSGAGDLGKGVAKGAGSAAAGTGKAAGDLVTLHPVGAASNLGRGAVGAGKDIGIGAVKGTGKILRGTGKAIKHLF